VPKNEKLKLREKITEIKETRITKKPANKIFDFGKIIFPSKNLATTQKTNEVAVPIIKSKLFVVSTEILEKGRKKIGIKIKTTAIDQKDILLKIFNIN
jgi:hypothetical protein